MENRQLIFTAQQVANLAGVSTQAIYKAWSAGKFPSSIRFGKTYMLYRADVATWLYNRGQRLEELEKESNDNEQV